MSQVRSDDAGLNVDAIRAIFEGRRVIVAGCFEGTSEENNLALHQAVALPTRIAKPGKNVRRLEAARLQSAAGKRDQFPL